MIYRGYSIFKRHNGRILRLASEFFPEDDKGNYAKGSLSRIGPNKFISVNKNYSVEEQIKTVIHKLLHLGLEYGTEFFKVIPGFPIPKETGYSRKQAIEYLDNLEKLIENETEIIFQIQPKLVSHLRQILTFK